MKEQLLELRRKQGKSYIQELDVATVYHEMLLPDMVDPNGDWSCSATKQWSEEAMARLKVTPATELVDTFALMNDPWLHMGVAAELILHDDVSRARAFTQGLIEKNPLVRADFAHYFGEPLVTELLKEDTVA